MTDKQKQTPEQRKANRAASQARWVAKNPGYNKEYYNREGSRAKVAAVVNYRRVKDNEPWLTLCRSSKDRAKAKGREHNLTPEYLHSIWPTNCPILGIPLSSSRERAHDASPTIDRIDSNKGYVIGNVCIISYKANVIKNSGTAEEHRLIAEYIDRLSEQCILS